jgi:hypothetical protein
LQRGNRVNHIIYRDAITLILVILIASVALMLNYLADASTETSGEMDSPGSIVAAVHWDAGNIDVDMWLLGPNETTPVFFSNRGGINWDLLRDDLGQVNDSGDLNYENAFTRGAPEGEYIINLVCYKCTAQYLPVHAHLQVQERVSEGAALAVVADVDVTLVRHGQEITAIRFLVGPDGRVIRDSISTIYFPMVQLRGYHAL